MKRTLIAVLILLVATAAVAGPGGRGAARGPEQGPGGPGGPGARRALLPPQAFAEFLTLTDAQITQIKTLRETERNTIKPLAEQQHANQQAIEAAVVAGNAAKAGELAVANYAIRQQIKAAHDAFKSSFEALLSSDQKAKLAVYEEIMQLRNQRPDGPPERP
jgi:Spy/CpxP family protein refolding chaperone